MKKIFLLICLTCLTISVNAQFSGGFWQRDPDAYFDKEPVFYAQNNCVNYYGYGQDLANVYIVHNGNWYSYSSIWGYGKYIIIGKEHGFDFSSGDVVSVYIGNSCIGTWKYTPSYTIELTDRQKAGILKGAAKGVYKLIKAIR